MKNIPFLIFAAIVSLGQLASSAPANCGSDLDRLADLTGLYVGELKVTSGSTKATIPFSIELKFRAEDGGLVLSGYYRRLDVAEGVIDLPLTVRFCQQPDSTEFEMVGRRALNYKIDIRATLSELMLAGSLTHLKGPNGTFILEKK